MDPGLRERFDRFDLLVTVLVFLDVLATVLAGPEHVHLLRWLLLFSALVFPLLWLGGRWWRITRFIQDFVPSFSVHDNRNVWGRVQRSYRYLGASGGSI